MKLKPRNTPGQRRKKLVEAKAILNALGFLPRQCNDLAGFALLSLLNLSPTDDWSDAAAPLRGIRDVKDYINDSYKEDYAENTRESIRDEAVKYFVDAGLLLRNPDKPDRPTNSGNTVYQIEPTALSLIKSFGSAGWPANLRAYLLRHDALTEELHRARELVRIPVVLPSKEKLVLSPGGQNPLIKAIVEEFCPRFVPGGTVVYVGDTETKFQHYHKDYLAKLNVHLDPAAKMPDVIVYFNKERWLLLIEAVTSAGPIDGKRRKELKDLFKGYREGLVFVTAFEDRLTMARFISQISWETEVWISENPDHIIHFNGERFLGPYPDTIQHGS